MSGQLTQQMPLFVYEKCKTCRGLGAVGFLLLRKCPECNGLGLFRVAELVTVKVVDNEVFIDGEHWTVQ